MVLGCLIISAFKKMKIIIFAVIALFVLFGHGGDLIGLAITAAVVYFIVTLFMPSDGHHPVAENQDDDDDFYDNKEEEDRLIQENIANQEALDRLL